MFTLIQTDVFQLKFDPDFILSKKISKVYELVSDSPYRRMGGILYPRDKSGGNILKEAVKSLFIF